jgi:hypothetical protein
MIKNTDEAAGGIFEGMAGNSFGQKEEIKKYYKRFEVLSAVLLRIIKSSGVFSCVTGWLTSDFSRVCSTFFLNLKK